MKPLALVVDRDAGTRKLLDVLLTRYGYEVDRVIGRLDAITLLDIVDYDFVLTDDEKVLHWMSVHRPLAMQRAMVLSSAPELELQRMRNAWQNVPIVRKPFELADVIEASRAAAANRPPRVANPREAYCRQSVMAGAKSGIIVRVTSDRIDLVSHFGYESGAVEKWFPLYTGDPYPICASIKRNRPVWLSSVMAERNTYPLLASVWQVNETRALAALPILRGGTVIGGAGWTFRDTQRFTEADQHVWLALGESAGMFIQDDIQTQSATQAGA